MNDMPTVFVIDDDQAIRESLEWLMTSVDLHVESYSNAQAFVSNHDPNRPGCIVLDIRMPGVSGLDLQAQLLAQGVQLPIIIITGHGAVPLAVRAMKAGAVDFLEKPFDDQVLLDRVQQAIQRDAENRRKRARRDSVQSLAATLTAREQEVMGLVVNGFMNKQIAHELSISEKTVESHRAGVMKKMRAESLAQLVKLSQSITPDDGGNP